MDVTVDIGDFDSVETNTILKASQSIQFLGTYLVTVSCYVSPTPTIITATTQRSLQVHLRRLRDSPNWYPFDEQPRMSATDVKLESELLTQGKEPTVSTNSIVTRADDFWESHLADLRVEDCESALYS